MFKINIRGLDPIFIQDGRELMEQFSTGKLPARVKILGSAFISTDIRSIQEIIDEPKTEYDNSQPKLQKEFVDYHRQQCNLPIEERAANMNVPKIVWRANANTPLPESIVPEITQRQLEFLKNHPNRIYANPKCYADLIERRVREKENKRMTPVGSWIGVAALKFVENIIRADIQQSNLYTPAT